MANDTTFITDLPEIAEVTDDTVFVSDDGSQTNSVKMLAILAYLIKNIDISDIDGMTETEILAELEKYLPLTGGTTTGNIIVKSSNYPGYEIESTSDGTSIQLRSYGLHSAILEIKNTAGSTANRRRIMLRDSNNTLPSLTDALSLANSVDNVEIRYNIYGAYNKPQGTYSGNSDATSRTVDVGGIGGFLLIRNTAKTAIAIVASGGAVAFNVASGTVTYFKKDVLNFTSGILTMSTSDALINASGYTYTYQLV